VDAEAKCVHVPACAPAHTTSRVPWRGRARKLLLALAGQTVGSEANTVRSAPPAVRCRSSPAACALTAAAQAGGGRSGGSHPGAGVPQAKRVCASRRPDLLRFPGALAQKQRAGATQPGFGQGRSPELLCRVCCSEVPAGARAVIAGPHGRGVLGGALLMGAACLLAGAYAAYSTVVHSRALPVVVSCTRLCRAAASQAVGRAGRGAGRAATEA